MQRCVQSGKKYLNESTTDRRQHNHPATRENLFLSLEQTHSRKFKEILLAMRMERYFSKEEILIGLFEQDPLRSKFHRGIK